MAIDTRISSDFAFTVPLIVIGAGGCGLSAALANRPAFQATAPRA